MVAYIWPIPKKCVSPIGNPKNSFGTLSFCIKQWIKKGLLTPTTQFNFLKKTIFGAFLNGHISSFVCMLKTPRKRCRPSLFYWLLCTDWVSVGVPEMVSLHVHFQSSLLVKMEVALVARKRRQPTLFNWSCFAPNEVLWAPPPRPVFH